MWQSMVTLNDSSVPPGLPLTDFVAPPETSSFLGQKRPHNEAFFEPPCDSDDDSSASSTSCIGNDTVISTLSPDISAVPTPNNKRRRQVTFGEEAQVAHVEKFVEKTLWYSKQDLFSMKSDAKRQSRQLNLDSTLAPAYGMPMDQRREDTHLPGVATSLRCKDFDSQRGLERWSSQMLMLSRCVTIVRARTEVHLEQINQTILGKRDPQRIADLYKQASTQAGSFARVLGIADEHAAED